ncbi:MAG: hypothetical protein QM788_03125 [Roseateles sp.]|uniref:hypothetical protein n=1 Tax=Roseateles sp. TaxID=1971397 RepID=UPI0039ED4A25
MSQRTAFFAAALALSAVAAPAAAPRDVVKLERVVITGKASRELAQLPRVIVNGYSEATLLRNATLAAAKAAPGQRA